MILYTKKSMIGKFLNKQIKILHISPHLGGGVGRVLINYFCEAKKNILYSHTVFCLDYINENAKMILNKNKINYKENIKNDINMLLQIIPTYDIILIHWWNHPLLFNLLVRYKFPESRIIIWSHVSGKKAPNIFSNALFKLSDLFIFSTPESFLIEKVIKYKETNNIFSHIWSTAGLSHLNKFNKKKSDTFKIGYIGTIDYAKIYPNFLNMLSKINIHNIEFIFCGDGNNLKEIKQEIFEKNIQRNFSFPGFITDINEYLNEFDIFCYPLNKNHYGTCDQVLAEAMGSGVPPIVFNNFMENYMIKHKCTGMVANDEDEFISYIEELYLNPKLREELSNNAKIHAFKHFSLHNMIIQWNTIYNKALKIPKSEKYWKGTYSGINTTHEEILKESLDISNNISLFEEIKNHITNDTMYSWFSESKGTPFQYHSFFPQDIKIKELCYLLKKLYKKKDNPYDR